LTIKLPFKAEYYSSIMSYVGLVVYLMIK
jgi:hypothetical protein